MTTYREKAGTAPDDDEDHMPRSYEDQIAEDIWRLRGGTTTLALVGPGTEQISDYHDEIGHYTRLRMEQHQHELTWSWWTSLLESLFGSDRLRAIEVIEQRWELTRKALEKTGHQATVRAMLVERIKAAQTVERLKR